MTVIVLPDPALVILVGASGSGKSTFAARHFAAAEILSTDAFRARLGRGEADQAASARAFAALYRGLAKRLGAGRLAVVDATNVRPTARMALVRLARTVADVPIVAIVLDLAELDCLAGDRARPGRAVGSEVIHRQWVALHRSLLSPGGLAGEGFAAVHVLSSAEARDGAVVARSATAPAPRQGADDPGAAGLP